MKLTSASALLLIALASTANAQPLTVRDVLAIKDRTATAEFGGRAEWGALTYYLQGAIEGTAAYQQLLLAENKSPAFCPPANKSYSVEEIFRYLEKSGTADRNRPATQIIIEAYARSFPCKN